jgi:hypothetical protein
MRCQGTSAQFSGSGSGIRCIFDPGIRDGKKSGSGSGMSNPDHISGSLKNNFLVKILKFFNADPGSGRKKIRLRDKHPGSATLLLPPRINNGRKYFLYEN